MDPKQRRAAARTLLLACGSALALGVPAARAADEAAAPPP
ncbi:MAG: hypothetical protein JWP23_2639, partial [Phenylobacterium sp.]|nr:hypothetical protein [Phenylobacterium sp.]